MKFYFCEKCGKRLTEGDIDQGQARNKKLRGVFCADCSVGVMTLETMPLDEERAKELLNAEAAAATPAQGIQIPGSTRGRRRTSAIRVPLHTSPRKERTAHREDAANEKAGMPPWVPIIGACAVVGVLGIVLWLSSGPQPTPPQRKQTLREAPSVQPAESSAMSGVTPPAAISEPVTPPESDTKPEAEQPAPPDPEPVALPVNPDLKPADSEPTPEPVTPAKSVAQNNPEPPKPVEPSIPDYDPEPLLKKVIDGLQAKGVGGATQALASDETMPDDTRAALRAALDWQSKWEEQVRAALLAKQGKEVTLHTGSGEVGGALTKIDEDGAWVQRRYKINGQWKDGPERRVRYEELAWQSRVELAPVPSPRVPEVAFAFALAAAGQAQWPTAEAALQETAGHPMAEAMTTLMKRQRAVALEEEARKTWAAWTSRVAGCTTSAQAKKLTEELAGFVERFGVTAFATDESHQAERTMHRIQLEQLVLGLDPRVAQLFHGLVKSYDPRTQTIEIHYDLANKEHLKDFKYKIMDRTKDPNQSTGVVETDKGVVLPCGSTIGRNLAHPAFAAGSVSVEGTLDEFKASYDGYRFGFEFGLPGSPGKADSVIVNFDLKGGTEIVGVGQFLTWLKIPMMKTVSPPRAPATGDTFYFGCEGNRYVVKMNGTEVVSHEAPAINDRSGVTFIVGRSAKVLLRHVVFKGRIDPRWLQAKLK